MKYSMAVPQREAPPAAPEKPQESPSARAEPPKAPPKKKPRAGSYEDILSHVLDGAAVEGGTRPHSMPHPAPTPSRKNRKMNAITVLLRIASGLALFAAGVLFIGWTSHRVDRQMRENILLQAQIVAHAINTRGLAVLSGTEADLSSPVYQRLKEQLTLIRKVDTQCRFIYVMGRRPDGKIFFYADSEDPASPDYSPPGEIFGEAMPDDYRVFDTGIENAGGGPYKDRWGTWVSAMVPVWDPDGGKMLGVLGMDFDAASWKLDVANRAAMPALPAGVAFIFGLYFIVAALRAAGR